MRTCANSFTERFVERPQSELIDEPRLVSCIARHEDAECRWMNERVLLGGDGAPLLTLAHIKKEADGAGYMPCGMDFAVPSSPGSPDRQFCSSTTQFAGDGGCATDDVKEEEGAPRRACLVCGDVASGFHYGVASCEACKAFFKRTIQGNIEYTCPAANDCEINKRRRKACQACRFQKCLRMGMLKEGVRLDRVRGGRQKYRRNADGPYQLQALPQLKPFPNLEDNKLLEALTVNEPDLSVTTPDIACTDPVIRMLNVLSDVYDQELVKIITWAKHIPGFLELSLNDQMRLLQSTWAEVLTLTVAFRSLPSTGELKFAADLVVDEKMARECGLVELHQQLSAVAARIERLGVTKEEYYVLKALILANSDVRIEDQQPLKRLRDGILAALTDCVTAVRAGGAPPSPHLHHLLLCLPAVRQADHLHRRFWSTVHRDGKVYMNKLFVEMLESYVR